MDQKYLREMYTRRSTIISLTNSEKVIVENIKNGQDENTWNKLNEGLRYSAKNWDKLVYTFCILFQHLFYVSLLY